MVRKIQILGTGHTSADKIAQRVDAAAKQLGIECEIERVTDVRRIMCFGPRLTPAVYIDGDIRTAGKAPTVQDLMVMLETPTHHRATSLSGRSHAGLEIAERTKSTP